MPKRTKVEVLKERFELLKNAYTDEDYLFFYTLADKIIIPVLQSDFEQGCEMWSYLLRHYHNKIRPVDFATLTDHVVGYCNYDILKRVFSANDEIREYVFHIDPYDSHRYCNDFIRDLIINGEYNLAEKLFDLLSRNTFGDNNVQKNIFEALYASIYSSESKWEMDSRGIDLLASWIPLVEDKIKRAELEVALIDLIECVENDAPKGSMPFSLYSAPGGLEKLLKEKEKQHKQSHRTTGSFETYMEERRNEKEIERIQKIDEMQDLIPFNIEEFNRYQKELNALIGLTSVKNEIITHSNVARVNRMRVECGLVAPDISNHMVFIGKPGTGKTTVARLIAKIYHALGLLSKGQLVEVDRSGLVAGYVGQTAIKTKEVIESALGGVLFIDEAYSLYSESENDFGSEAIETLLKAMEDYRNDLIVIVAGYESKMIKFISSNPGLRSRFTKYISFSDYSGSEMMEIFLSMLQKHQFHISAEADQTASQYFDSLYIQRNDDFGNARDVRTFFERTIMNQANRLINSNIYDESSLSEIIAEDLPIVAIK